MLIEIGIAIEIGAIDETFDNNPDPDPDPDPDFDFDFDLELGRPCRTARLDASAQIMTPQGSLAHRCGSSETGFPRCRNRSRNRIFAGRDCDHDYDNDNDNDSDNPLRRSRNFRTAALG